MENKDQLKEIDIKNRRCSYFDDIMRLIGISNIFLNEKSYKSYKNILIFNILCKIFVVLKQLLIRFDETDGFIRTYDGSRYLVLFGFRL